LVYGHRLQHLGKEWLKSSQRSGHCVILRRGLATGAGLFGVSSESRLIAVAPQSFMKFSAWQHQQLAHRIATKM
jgi:hypothetical protein